VREKERARVLIEAPARNAQIARKARRVRCCARLDAGRLALGYLTCATVSMRAFVYGVSNSEDFDEPRGESTAYSPK
jgi:hypothetical protein